MKIRKLTIHNIASIADAVIDFDGDVLGNSDLFLIYGDTGAGKSVILDCICLVLFNDAPRLRTEMEGKTDIDTNSGGLTLKDPRQMLRRGTGEGFAELTFTGNDGVDYKGIWSARRAGNKPGGKFQAVKRIIEWQGGVAEKSEVNAVVRKAVGMDMVQFQRTTMLAQGQFSMFLNSKDKDRADLLGRLLDVGVYNEISMAISRRLRDENAALESLSAEAGAVRPLTPDELEALRAEIADKSGALAQFQKEHAAAASRTQWFVTLSRINTQLSVAREDLERARAALLQPGYIAARRTCEDMESAAPVLASLRARAEAKRRLRECRGRAVRLSADFRALLAGVNSLRTQHLANETAIADHRALINSCAERAAAFENADAILEKLKRLVALRAKSSATAARIPMLHKTVEKQSVVLENATKAAEESRLAVERMQARVEECDGKLRALGYDELREAVKNLTAREGRLNLAQKDSDACAEKKGEIEKLRVQLAEASAQLPVAADELTAAAASDKACAAALAALELSFGKVSESLSEWARVARAQLQPGDLCPVCRRPVGEHFESDDEILAALQPMKKDIDRRRAACDAAREALQNARLKDSLLVARVEELKSQIGEQSRALDAQRAKFQESLAALGISESEIAAELSAVQRRLEINSEKLRGGVVVQRALDDLRVQLKTLHQKKDLAAAALLKAQKNFEQASAAETAAADLLATFKESEKTECASIAEALGTWSADFSTDPAAFAERLAASAKEFSAAKKEIDSLTNINNTFTASLRNIREPMQSVSEILRIEPSEVSESRPIDGIETKFGNLAALTRSNSEEIAAVNEQLLEIKASVVQYISQDGALPLRRVFELYGFSDEKIRKCTFAVETAEKERAAAVSALSSVEEMLKKHIADKPAMPDGADEESCAKTADEMAAKVADCSAALGALRERLQYDEELRIRKADILARIAAQQEVADKWTRLDRLFGSADGKKFGTIALRYILGHLLDKANLYLRRIMPRYSLCCQRDSLLIMVRDAYLNGAMRPANGISGGETFVVSLALALALSDVGNRFNMDILFIDEGFGSLSGEPLEAAVDLLRSLHHGMGRRVGIISHVAELRERISARIRVERGARCSQVSLEHD